MKREILAAVLSAVLPGAGQLYNRHWLKGAGFLTGVTLISGVIRPRALFGGPPEMGSLITVLLFAAVLFGIAIWSVADAYLSARQAS